MPGFLVGEGVEAVVAVMSGLRAHAAPDLDDIALRLAGAAEQLHRIFAGGLADEHIVAADELGDALGVDVAVEHDHRNLGVDRLFDDAGQAGRFLGRDQQHVDLLIDKVLDVGDLLFCLVLPVGDDELDLRVILRLGLDVLVELHAPRLERGALAESDFPFRRGLGRRPAGRQVGGHRRARERRRELEKFTSFHGCPPLRLTPLRRSAAEQPRPIRSMSALARPDRLATASTADPDSAPARAPCRR